MIRTAVILAARKERDSEIPYPIKPFCDGVNLMDRNIGILREFGVDKILILAGYRAELFDHYVSEDVSVIINPEYEFTASMGSLAMCRDVIDNDFLLIDGDTFFERELIGKMCSVEEGNCLSMTEESGSGDECFVETKNGFVVKISKDRHRVCNFEGEMIGVTRISRDTFRRMIEAWDNATNPYLNYEYVLMDVTDPLDRPVILFKNILWGDVDCMEDYKKLDNVLYRKLRRKENPYDEDNLRSYLKSIFPDCDPNAAMIMPIGGMSNKNYKIDLDGKSYVLRVPGNGSDGMVDRANEEFNACEASRLGINPPVRYFNPITGIKLADYILNAESLNAATVQRHDNMRKIAEIYRTIHNSHIRLRNEFNIFKEIGKYDVLLEKAGAEMYHGWQDVRAQVMELEQYLNTLGVDIKPCHNDALYENFIKSADGKIYLIDWEYSGMNDPMADFAALFVEADFEEENVDYILSRYFDGHVPDDAKRKVLCYTILWDYLWSQWTVIKEARGDDFGTYGIERFNRAIRNLEVLHQQMK